MYTGRSAILKLKQNTQTAQTKNMVYVQRIEKGLTVEINPAFTFLFGRETHNSKKCVPRTTVLVWSAIRHGVRIKRWEPRSCMWLWLTNPVPGVSHHFLLFLFCSNRAYFLLYIFAHDGRSINNNLCTCNWMYTQLSLVFPERWARGQREKDIRKMQKMLIASLSIKDLLLRISTL